MLDPRLFTPLPVAQRKTMDADYLAFVRERDGEPDLRARTLSRREDWFRRLGAELAPAWDGEAIESGRFTQWHHGALPIREAPPLVQWLVAIARANEGEAWGVNYLLDRGGFQGLGRGGVLKPRDFADLEETYHTRIFHEIVRLFGLEFELRDPPGPIQTSVKLMAHIPDRLSFLLLAAGELMGTVSFLELAHRGERILREHPRIWTRIQALLDEILVDEVGHVTYLLGSMGRLDLTLVRQVARGYLRYTRRSYQRHAREQTASILQGIENYSLGLFPERVLRRAFVPQQYWPTEIAA